MHLSNRFINMAHPANANHPSTSHAYNIAACGVLFVYYTVASVVVTLAKMPLYATCAVLCIPIACITIKCIRYHLEHNVARECASEDSSIYTTLTEGDP